MSKSALICAPEEASDGVVQMAWARDASTRRPAHVSEVSRGAGCGCACLGCGAPMVARKGPQTAHHFAHKAETSDCSPALIAGGWETDLHQIAKEVLADNSAIFLPELVARRFGREVRLRKRRKITYEQSHREHQAVRALALEGIVPDAVIYVDGHPLSIEIRVTHESKEPKRKRMAAQGLHGIQVDLRATSRFATRAEIATAVLNTAEREWLYHRALAPAVAAIEAEVSAQERAAQARLDAAIAAVKSAYNAPRTPTASLCPDLVRAGLSGVIGLSIEGQEYIAESAASWQARVLNLIFAKGKAPITAPEVLAALGNNILHPGFRAWRSWDASVLQGLSKRFNHFQTPEAVVGRYFEALGRREIIRQIDRFRRGTWILAFDLQTRLKQVDDEERRLTAVRDLAAELAAASGEPFDLDAWMQTEQPHLYAAPAALCLQSMTSAWTFSSHPADKLIENLQGLRRLSKSLPRFERGHSGPPPWATWPSAPSAMTTRGLIGLPLITLLESRQQEEEVWRAAETAELARIAEEARLAQDRREREDGAVFLADFEAKAAAAFEDPATARAWAAEQVGALVLGPGTIIPATARQHLSQALQRTADQRAAAAREARETAEAFRLVLETRAPLFADAAAAVAWLRSPRALDLQPDAQLPAVLPSLQRSLLRAALQTAVQAEETRRARDDEAAHAGSAEVVALREELRLAAQTRWGSAEDGERWLTRGRLADAHQKPIDRCRDRASLAELVRDLDADILVARNPPKVACRRRR